MDPLFKFYRMIAGGVALWVAAVALPLPRAEAHHSGEGVGAEAGLALDECAMTIVTNLRAFSQALKPPEAAVPVGYVRNYSVPVAPELCCTNYAAAVAVYEMPMTSLTSQFHPDLPPMEVWGYAGHSPGPTINAEVNVPILVNWSNQLPPTYPPWLLADTTLHGVENQDVRTVVHLHGAAVLPRYDGYPTNWFKSGHSDLYFYQNLDLNDDGETLWYHDHAIGVTANNVYAGLAGFYLLRNTPLETAFATNGHPLPSGKYEIPLLIQDKDFQQCPTNQLLTALLIKNVPPWHYHAVVNGLVTPYLEVEPTKYRFRILNGAGFRTWGLNLQVSDTNGVPNTNQLANLPMFTVLGTEDGFLPSPTNVPTIKMMSGERVDVVIDFTGFANTNITMVNRIGKAQVPSTTGPFITNIMQFRVTSLTTNPATTLPAVLVPPADWVATSNLVAQAVTNRQLTLDLQFETPFPGPPFVTNNGVGYFALINMTPFEKDVDDFPIAGDTEIWSIINLTDEPHPLHVHLLDFRVVDRTRFGTGINNTSWNEDLANPPAMVAKYINDRINHSLAPLATYLDPNPAKVNTAAPFEAGPKDVVHAAPFAVTRIVMQWPTNSLFYTTPSGTDGDPRTDGRYIFHCHILDHEDNDMMRPLQLKSPDVLSLQVVPDSGVNPAGQNHFRLRVRTLPGTQYYLETTASLSAPLWARVPGTESLSDGLPAHHLPLPSADESRFYRVRAGQ